MQKRLLFLLLLTACTCLTSIGQTWFIPGQQAYEIRVPQEGLYAITAGRVGQMAALIGSPVNGLKLFHNGTQVAIRLADADQSGTWTANDTLWFFGQMNHGEAENAYYQFADYQNKYAPLYSQAGFYYMMSTPGNGLRMQTTTAASAPSPVVTDWTAELVLAPRQEYSYGNGAYQYSKFHQSHIGQGEGWCSVAFNAAVNFTVANPYTVRAGQAKVLTWMNGRNALPHRGVFKLGTTQVISTDFANYERKIDSGFISTAGIGASIPLTLSPGLTNDYISLMLAKISLPVQPVAVDQPVVLKSYSPNQGHIKLPTSVGSGLFLQLNDPNKPKVLRLSSSQYVAEADSANGGLTAIWLQRKAFEIKDSLVEAKMLNVSDRPLGGGFLIITSRKLADTAQQYTDYRASIQGGSHVARMVYVEDMFAQYSFGYPTSQAIRAYLLDNMGSTKPKAVFLLGKALMHTTLLADSILKENHVPTWGVPASDNYLTITDTGGFHNKIPISRLAAKNGREILTYLDKVKAQDSNTDRLWRKNTYHLSGGRTAGEIDQFREYIMAYSQTVRAPLIGGTPYEFSKTSASVIEAVNIRDKINAGVSILNLFGHSASTTTDVDIGLASDEGQGYQNEGRYPLVIINGCFAGNIYERGGLSLNENWMLTPGKGAIAFSGSMDEGLPPLLDRHTTLLYKHQFSDTTSSSKSIGELYQMANQEYVGPYSNVFDSIMVEQIILHGDPLLTLFPYSKPDYMFDGVASKIVSQSVSGLTKSFALRLTVQNPGIYRPGDSLGVVGRITSGGRTYYGDPVKLTALRRDTVIDYQVSGALELDNTSVIECNVDYLNQVNEQSEDNNTLTISLGRFENGVSFVYPTRDAIVSDRVLNLVYRNLQPAAGSTIAIELDTSRHFTSGLRQIIDGGSLILNQTQVTLPNLPDSTVFYIRYRIETNNQGAAWQSYAFTLIRGEEGWSQSTGFQYQDNQIEGYNLDSSKIHQPWSFTEKQVTIRMYTPGSAISATYRNSGIDINGIPYFYGTQNSCLGYPNSLLTLRLNRNSLEPYVDRWQQPFEEFWRYSCGRVPTVLNYYSAPDLLIGTGSLSGYNIQQMHPGDYYFAMSHGFIDWSHVGFWYIGSATFVGAHADSIKKALPGSPMITFGIRTQGSSPNVGYTVLASKFDTINDLRTYLDTTFVIRKYPGAGKVESPFIGPAIDFKKLVISSTANGQPDSALLTVRGYATFSDTGTVIYQGVPHGLNLSGIPGRFHYVRLTFESPNLEDSTNYLNAWKVTYVPYPEGVAIDADASSPVNAGDTVVIRAKYNHTINNVGDQLAATLYVRNLAGVLLDTLGGIAVKPVGVDTSYVNFRWKSNLNSPDTVAFEVLFNAHYVPEGNYTNNSAFAQAILRKDTTHYSGYFEIDGMLAENGMQVNSSPVITYRLNRDFTGKTIALSFGGNCDSCSPRAVSDFTVAGNEVRFAPHGLASGTYSCLASVHDPYKLLVPVQLLNFEVVTKDTLSLFKVFPNPASGSVTFTYQCTAANQGGTMELSVYNAFGDAVFTGQANHPGTIAGVTKWDLRSDNQPIDPGVYLARVKITVNAANGSAQHILSGTARVVVVR